MCTINMTFEVPDSRAIDIEALKKQMQAFFTLVVSTPSILKKDTEVAKEPVSDLSIFDCFSGDFGGERDSHEIAAELHDSRIFTRSVDSL